MLSLLLVALVTSGTMTSDGNTYCYCQEDGEILRWIACDQVENCGTLSTNGVVTGVNWNFTSPYYVSPTNEVLDTSIDSNSICRVVLAGQSNVVSLSTSNITSISESIALVQAGLVRSGELAAVNRILTNGVSAGAQSDGWGMGFGAGTIYTNTGIPRIIRALDAVGMPLFDPREGMAPSQLVDRVSGDARWTQNGGINDSLFGIGEGGSNGHQMYNGVLPGFSGLDFESPYLAAMPGEIEMIFDTLDGWCGMLAVRVLFELAFWGFCVGCLYFLYKQLMKAIGWMWGESGTVSVATVPGYSAVFSKKNVLFLLGGIVALVLWWVTWVNIFSPTMVSVSEKMSSFVEALCGSSDVFTHLSRFLRDTVLLTRYAWSGGASIAIFVSIWVYAFGIRVYREATRV